MAWTLEPRWALEILRQFVIEKGFSLERLTTMGEGNDLNGQWAKINILSPPELYGPYTVVKATDTQKAQVVNNMTWEIWQPSD